MYAGTLAWDSLTETDPLSSVSLAKHSAAFTEYGAPSCKNIVVEGNFLNESHVTLVSATGQVISQKVLSQNYGQVQFENLPTGPYIAIIRGRNMVQTSTIQVK